MVFVSSCQTDALTLIKGGDMTMLLQALIFFSPLPKETEYIQEPPQAYSYSKYVLHGVIQVGRDLKMSPVQPAESKLRCKVRQGCLGLYPVGSWSSVKDADSITSLGSILLPSLPLSCLSPKN